MILEDDAGYEPLTFSSTDLQHLELRRFQVSEIARAFRIPPHMLADLERTTHNNAEEMGSQFLQLSPAAAHRELGAGAPPVAAEPRGAPALHDRVLGRRHRPGRPGAALRGLRQGHGRRGLDDAPTRRGRGRTCRRSRAATTLMQPLNMTPCRSGRRGAGRMTDHLDSRSSSTRPERRRHVRGARSACSTNRTLIGDMVAPGRVPQVARKSTRRAAACR